jgi:hypothetical protein
MECWMADMSEGKSLTKKARRSGGQAKTNPFEH